MNERLSRTEMLLGSEAVNKLKSCRVAVFGLGGVGGSAAEALARGGIGRLDLIDNDTVSVSNINRQILALESTVGKYKTDAAMQRIRDISPDIEVCTHRCFFLPDTADSFDFTQYDYVIDAIDTVTGKLEIIKRAKAAGVPVISSMGTGNKLDPTALKIADISETKVCPLARVMRYELRKLGISGVKVLYSEEPPLAPADGGHKGKRVPGSVSFVPPAAGLIIAGEVLLELCGKK